MLSLILIVFHFLHYYTKEAWKRLKMILIYIATCFGVSVFHNKNNNCYFRYLPNFYPHVNKSKSITYVMNIFSIKFWQRGTEVNVVNFEEISSLSGFAHNVHAWSIIIMSCCLLNLQWRWWYCAFTYLTKALVLPQLKIFYVKALLDSFQPWDGISANKACVSFFKDFIETVLNPVIKMSRYITHTIALSV